MKERKAIHSTTNKTIIKHLRTTKKFIKNHPEILFIRADKGNTTVVLNKNEYIKNMEIILNDNTTYKIINKDQKTNRRLT